MKKVLLSLLSLTAIYTGAFSQLLYSNTVNQGTIYNPGANAAGHPYVVFDDVNIPSFQVGGSDSVAITKVKFGLSRSANAPAVTVNFYYAPVNPSSTTLNNRLITPPVQIGSITFSSPNGASVVDTTVSLGDSVNALFKVKTLTGFPYTGQQTLFLGASFSTNVAGSNNGWRVALPSESYNDNHVWIYDLDANAVGAGTLNNGVYSTFNLQVFGFPSGGLLPISLSGLKGERIGTVNTLSWTTENEQNNKGFEIQRSVDGVNFSTISFVASKAPGGSSSSKLSYQFTDNTPYTGDAYYRLKQVDIGSKSNLSSVVLLKGLNANALVLSSIYPNPAINSLNVVVAAPSAQKLTFVITDLAGKVLMQKPASIIAGTNNLSLSISNLSSGNYFIKIASSNGSETNFRKFVKQ